MDDTLKKISISGTNNKYHMKKIMNGYETLLKKRVDSKNWTFSEEDFTHSNQMNMIIDISNNISNINITNSISKIAIQQINKKISSYKQQDILKKHLNNDTFVTFESVILKMIECELKCRYCKKEMSVLYEISREMCQWSIDRIDNNLGHNIDNYHLACLECNLKRRRQTDEKFLFTKQLNIVKTV